MVNASLVEYQINLLFYWKINCQVREVKDTQFKSTDTFGFAIELSKQRALK